MVLLKELVKRWWYENIRYKEQKKQAQSYHEGPKDDDETFADLLLHRS